jgi:hypothetical protein
MAKDDLAKSVVAKGDRIHPPQVGDLIKVGRLKYVILQMHGNTKNTEYFELTLLSINTHEHTPTRQFWVLKDDPWVSGYLELLASVD